MEARIRGARARWRLTLRGRAVLRVRVRGDSNKDIPSKLGASVATVEVHVSNILKKTRSGRRTAVVVSFYTG